MKYLVAIMLLLSGCAANVATFDEGFCTDKFKNKSTVKYVSECRYWKDSLECRKRCDGFSKEDWN